MKVSKIVIISICLSLFIVGFNKLIITYSGDWRNIKYLNTENIKVNINRWKATNPICLESQSGDSYRFGDALAINNRYLAVGDPKANRVIIYSHNDDNKWTRTNEILPPKNSSAFRIGSGFGYDLALDGATLVIGAYTIKSKKDIVSTVSPGDYIEFTFEGQIKKGIKSGGIYRTRLDHKIEVERIDKPATNSISGWSIDADQGRIAFPTSYLIKPEESDWEYKYDIWNWSYKYHILQADGSIKSYTPPVDNKNNMIFVRDIAIKNNLLLIGSYVIKDSANPYSKGGEGWLYNIDIPMKKPQRLAAKNYHMGSSVALSSQFATLGGGMADALDSEFQKTLINRLDNNSTTVIDGVGDVTLNGSILARFRHGSKDRSIPGLLEVFELDEKAIPRLIKRREYIERALLQDGYLIVIEQISPQVEICIEQLN